MIVHNRHNARYMAHHVQDNFTDLGYDYRKSIFKKTISKVIYRNDNNRMILNEIEKMIVYLIDTVKQIRLQYMISLDKNDRNVN